MKRKDAIIHARVAGYHNDMRTFVRLLVEERVNRSVMDKAWSDGVKAKQQGVRCDCFFCKREPCNSTPQSTTT